MIVLRFFGRMSVALVRTLWKGDLMTKLLTMFGLGIGVALLGSLAGPATTQLAEALLVLTFLFAVYSLALRG